MKFLKQEPTQKETRRDYTGIKSQPATVTEIRDTSSKCLYPASNQAEISSKTPSTTLFMEQVQFTPLNLSRSLKYPPKLQNQTYYPLNS